MTFAVLASHAFYLTVHQAGGKDHFFWMAADSGACRLEGPFMDKPIKVPVVCEIQQMGPSALWV